MLEVTTPGDTGSTGYRFAVSEIVRGIEAVSGLTTVEVTPGQLGVLCESPTMARWLAEAISRENVSAQATGNQLMLPVADDFTLEGEIKSIITVVAKTTDYWQNHLLPEVKQALIWQDRLGSAKSKLTGWFRRD